MIRFNCDKCDMEIELDDEFAGTKHECLGCGDINRVPYLNQADHDLSSQTESGHIDTKKIDRAAEAGFPPDFGPEVRILVMRRCWVRSRAIRFTLVVLGLVCGLVGLVWVPFSDQSWIWYVLFVPMVIGTIGLMVWWWIDRLNASLEITTKRTIMHHGIFSKSSSEVVHDNIRNIQIDQTFLQRLTNVGRIGISSSGQDGIELQVNHLKDPDNLRKIIDLYRPL